MGLTIRQLANDPSPELSRQVAFGDFHRLVSCLNELGQHFAHNRDLIIAFPALTG